MELPALFLFILIATVHGHSLYRRDVDEGGGQQLHEEEHVHEHLDGQVDNDTDVSSGPFMTKNKIGFKLVHHNNPDFPGEKRHMQAMDSPLFTGICNPDQVCTNGSYRSFDGSCNNLANPGWGQAGIPFRRLLPPKQSLIRCGVDSGRLPNARAASVILVDRTEADKRPDRSMMVMIFGQLIDHDITLTPLRRTPEGEFLDCCFPPNIGATECCPILISKTDPFFSAPGRTLCIPLLRSSLTVQPGSRCRQRPDVENANTAYIDASFLYGSDKDRANFLRTMSGGRLKVTMDNRNRAFPPITSDKGFRMNFGDTRGDVHPGFTLLHTTFLRNHNKLASALAGFNPTWSDEILFQEAKKINTALLQHITYTQFIDALLGDNNDVRVQSGSSQDLYNPNVDATISLPFSTSAYRLHTFVPGTFNLLDKDFKDSGKLLLRDIFHKPLTLLANNNYDDLLRGLSLQPAHDYNNQFTPEMTEWLFPNEGQDFGLDIVALNVQRGRDHQLQGYPAYRKLCGLGDVQNWNDLRNTMPESAIRKLQLVYQRPDDVDLYIGQNMEFVVAGSMLGPTARCIIRDQFLALREGDRFFYTRPKEFTSDQLNAIRKTTLSRILCDNSDDPANLRISNNVFQLASGSNPIVPCSDFSKIPPLDLSAWR